jgi:hypothetical protein
MCRGLSPPWKLILRQPPTRVTQNKFAHDQAFNPLQLSAHRILLDFGIRGPVRREFKSFSA